VFGWQALRGANQIIKVAIDTLQRELPPKPPTIADLRKTESDAKKEAVAKLRLKALRIRNQPYTPDESPVGKL